MPAARKKVQQTARSLLPNETEVPMAFTGNVRALRHICARRADEHGDVIGIFDGEKADTAVTEEARKRFLESNSTSCAPGTKTSRVFAVDPILFGDYQLQLPDLWAQARQLRRP